MFAITELIIVAQEQMILEELQDKMYRFTTFLELLTELVAIELKTTR